MDGSHIYFVSPQGDDNGPGNQAQPFRTLAYARDQVRKHPSKGQQPITVCLRAGTYYLDDTLTFTRDDSGTGDAPITYSAFENESVVISGGSQLKCNWSSSTADFLPKGVMQSETPAGIQFDQLFINGSRQQLARYPNYDPDVLPYNGYSEDAFSPERAERWANPEGGFIHAMHRHHWGGYHYRITGKDADNTVTFEGGWQNNRQMGMHDAFRFVENIREELDAPGEWFHDAATHTLYYYPASDLDLSAATFEVARLKQLVAFEGSESQPVQHIHLKGLVFRHTARTFMDTREPLLRSDWTIYRGGAVTLTGTEDCGISDCTFDQVGGNAVFVNRYNRRMSLRSTHIHGAGASGVCFVGDPDSVRNPLFEYNERQAYADIDRTPGPKSNNYPADSLVENCLIHGVSVVEKQATGVQISMSQGITVRQCSIYDVGRAGINISEGTFGGHLIECCDVFDTVRETGDHGSFNSWGRDRFWQLEDAPPDQLPDLALLDAKKTVIRNSRWRCDHGWDVDLDDGSSNYEIYNNVFLRGGLKLREGFHREVYNNIAVNGAFHPHVWYENSGDRVSCNIWMAPYRPAGMEHWNNAMDRNFFTSPTFRDAFLDQGCDAESLVGDPLFMDPENGDYRVQPDSPVLALGFKNFPMDQFGVQTARLKAIARVPELPEVAPATTAPTPVVTHQWRGATVSALSGEEYSAFGVNKDDGGIHVIDVPASSAAAALSLQKSDLIQDVNGQAVKTVEELLAAEDAGDEQPPVLRIVRYQHSQILETP